MAKTRQKAVVALPDPDGVVRATGLGRFVCNVEGDSIEVLDGGVAIQYLDGVQLVPGGRIGPPAAPDAAAGRQFVADGVVGVWDE